MFRKKKEESLLRQGCFRDMQDMQPLVSWFRGASAHAALATLPEELEKQVWHQWWQEDTYTVLESFAKRLEDIWDGLVQEGVYAEDHVIQQYRARIDSLRSEERMWRGKIEEAWREWERLLEDLTPAHQAGKEIMRTYAIYPESFPLTLLKLENARDSVVAYMRTNPLSKKKEEVRTQLNTFVQECDMFKEIWDEIDLVFREAEGYERYKGWVQEKEEEEYPSFQTQEEVMNEVLRQKVEYYADEEELEHALPEEDVRYLEKKQGMLFAIQRGAYRETRAAIADFRNELEICLYDMHMEKGRKK